MVHSGRWEPSPWSKKEQKLRKIMDAKNARDRKRKNRKIENDDAEMFAAASAWVQEGQADGQDLHMEDMVETGTGETTSSESTGATSSKPVSVTNKTGLEKMQSFGQGTLYICIYTYMCIAVCFKQHF